MPASARRPRRMEMNANTNSSRERTSAAPATSTTMSNENSDETNGASGRPTSDSTNSRPLDIHTIEPGIVHMRGFLSLEEQQTLAQSLMSIGCSSGEYGFYKQGRDGQRTLNAAKTRGRIYQSLPWYHERLDAATGNGLQQQDNNAATLLSSICERAVELACEADAEIHTMTPTHLLTLYYATKTGIRWHQDTGENDGTKEHPVVSFSLGNACTFQFQPISSKSGAQLTRDKSIKPKQVRLESGDCLIFGGRARMMFHAVTHIFKGTSPLAENALLGDARMNLTFREAPEVLGREDEFRYFVASKKKLRADASITTPATKN